MMAFWCNSSLLTLGLRILLKGARFSFVIFGNLTVCENVCFRGCDEAAIFRRDLVRNQNLRHDAISSLL